MSDENAIMLAPNLQLNEPKLTPEGEQMIEQALAGVALIGRVSNEVENKVAVDGQIELKRLLNLLEKTRVEITKPALEFQRKVKAFFDSKKVELEKELFRTGRLTSDYASLQLAKARAEENARKEELTRLEREREAALAKANSHEEREILQDHYNKRAEIEAPPVAGPDRAKGQVVKTDLEITVSDVWALARSHPTCVDIKPRLSEIKSLIKAGIKVAGVTSREVVVSGVRAPISAPIEV